MSTMHHAPRARSAAAFTPRLLLLAALISAAAALSLTADESVRTFKVEARRDTADSPLKTGLHVTQGQRLLLMPNPDDRWHNKGQAISYKGRKKAPQMKLEWGIDKPHGPITSEQHEVTAHKSGELVFNCADRRNVNNNTGFIRVSVKLLPKQ